jgi:TonB family protein
MRLVCLLLIVCFPCPINARQNKARGGNALCEGGILNSKVTFESKPVYPTAARKARAEGSVVVKVRIDEGGNIFEAVACSGHPLLRQAAADAAYQTRLSQTVLSGKSVKVSGVLVYVFRLNQETGRLYKP